MLSLIKIEECRSIFKYLVVCIFLVFTVILNGQTDKKYLRKGNREYEKNKYSESEISYRKAIDKNKQSPDAIFNVGDALYKQNKYEEAGKQFVENASINDDKVKKSAGLYNLGNSLLKANKIEESIAAYKSSLKLRPGNAEAKYNLSYAQDMLRKQQEQQKKQQQDQDKKDQNKDKNKDDQKKDQKDQNDKNKDQQKDQDKNQDKDQQQQPQKQEISKEDAQRLLNSLANDEKNVQEKVKLAKATKAKVRTVKNW
jgi:tetratricopeptide (TPR) repeat protein